MTNTNDRYLDSLDTALNALIDAALFAPADAHLDPDDAPISTADLADAIIDLDDDLPIYSMIHTIAFDIFDLDDEMLIDRIQTRSDNR